MPDSILRFCKTRVIHCCFWSLLCLLALAYPLSAQYQQSPPDFGGTYAFPTPTHPEPAAGWMRTLDVGLLAFGLGVAAWLILKSRNRKGVMLLSIASVAYFGFYRKGCICSVGAIQNVVLCLVKPQYIISLGTIAIFFLPLVATLLLAVFSAEASARLGLFRILWS